MVGIAPYFLPPLLTAFSRKYPLARVTIEEEITPLLLEKLRAGAVDIAVLALPVRGHEFESIPLMTEKLFAVLPRKHALARKRALSLVALRQEPFLLLRDGHCFRESAVAACERVRLKPQIIFESGQFSSILSMVNAGLKRLGINGRTRQYFALHATLDIKHAEAWNREVLTTLVAEQPDLARPIAEGALLRLRAGARCFERYRHELGLNRLH